MALSRLVLATAIAAASAAVAFAPQANAADGTITITGKVIDTTCQVTNGTNGNISVTLPVVQTSQLASDGTTAGDTGFSLVLSDCPTTPSGIEVGAQLSSANVNTTTGNLTNNGGSASNVEVRLLDKDGTPIDVSSTPTTDSTTLTGSTAELDYTAQYYATGTATAGDVTATAEYTLVYN